MTENIPPADDAWRWRKSSFSQPNGGECVELGCRKSSVSQPNGDCVELASGVDAVRDSKNSEVLELSSAGLSAFMREVEAGRLQR